MRDALLSSDDPTLSGDAPLTLTSREFVALTGVTAERVRTWQRRFGFPASTPDRRGRRGFFATDVPRVLAVKQLVAGGEPVAEAVRGVLAGRALRVDSAVLEDAFGALPAPVVAVAGAAQVEVVWANAAALDAAPGDDARELPHPLADRSSALRNLLVEPPESPVWLAHRPWFSGAEPTSATELITPVRSMVWAFGAPTFVPAILVIVDIPVADLDAATEAANAQAAAQARDEETAARSHKARTEREWAGAVGAARRALQRGVGRRAIDDALGALVAAKVVDDAMIVLPQGDEMRVVLSAKGRPLTAALSAQARLELVASVLADGPVPLEGEAARELSGCDGRQVFGAPLIAGRAELGYVVLVADQSPASPCPPCDLVMAFASNLAAAISRDRAARRLQRARAA